ncbi:MAG TPA: LysR substrate-binding domain-containing protein [Kiloniellales bacterium]|nr:LysR substrate-binding domain-containing protein [Kiloniellales bacterium]
MAKRLPPLNPLRAFEAAARTGSLTRAAGELNVTHGAISHQVKTLEESLGVILFERIGRGLRLTAHGAELLPAVSAAFDGIAAATARMTRPTGSGTLSISCVPALLTFWIMPRLGSFIARYPDISLTFDASNDHRALRAPDVDICILYGDGSWSDCWLKRWSHLDLFPVMSPTLMNSKPLRSVRGLGNHVMLHADEGREWQQWLAAADALDLPRGPQHSFSDARLVIEAAMLGHGVALGDTMTTATLLAKGQLVAPFNLTVPAVDAFYVACRRDLRSVPIVGMFIDWLFAQLEEDDARTIPQIAARKDVRRESDDQAAASEAPTPRS